MKRPSYKNKIYPVKSMQFNMIRSTDGSITILGGNNYDQQMTFTPKEARKIARKMLRWARKGTA